MESPSISETASPASTITTSNSYSQPCCTHQDNHLHPRPPDHFSSEKRVSPDHGSTLNPTSEPRSNTSASSPNEHPLHQSPPPSAPPTHLCTPASKPPSNGTTSWLRRTSACADLATTLSEQRASPPRNTNNPTPQPPTHHTSTTIQPHRQKINKPGWLR